MIQEIRLSNFFSIKDEIVLDLKAGSLKTQKSRRLDQNVINFNDKHILKTIAIYGSNAAGKSNLINAIRFCARMIFNSHTHNENAIFNFQPFKFNNYSSKPSTFLINFILEETEYEYAKSQA